MEFKVLVKVVLLLSLIGFTATTVDATRFDPSSFITRLLPNDVGPSCHSACRTCCCLWGNPPKCHCLDHTLNCYDKCTSFKAEAD
ncbi:hypothetical protein AAZX31_18G212600 [Glycine max]